MAHSINIGLLYRSNALDGIFDDVRYGFKKPREMQAVNQSMMDLNRQRRLYLSWRDACQAPQYH